MRGWVDGWMGGGCMVDGMGELLHVVQQEGGALSLSFCPVT